MKTLSIETMENMYGGGWWTSNHSWSQHGGCAAYAIAAGIASGLNPIVGGLTMLGCYLLLD
ncbi:MAG: hypothetical protein ACOZDD_16430 [Bacteroidota bacterium]